MSLLPFFPHAEEKNCLFSTVNLLPHSANSSIDTAIMSFSSLVQDLSLRDTNAARRPQIPGPRSSVSTLDDRASHISRAMSYTSTAATSVSISGDISSQLHGGYFHPLARSWQAERQLTKVSAIGTRDETFAREKAR